MLSKPPPGIEILTASSTPGQGSDTVNRPLEGWKWRFCFPLWSEVITETERGHSGRSLGSSAGSAFDLLCDLKQISRPLWASGLQLYHEESLWSFFPVLEF